METKNKIGFVLVVLVMLFLAGCSGGTEGAQQSGLFGRGDANSNSGSSSNTNGVILKFAENRPPSEMFKGEGYTFAFIFENHQNHPVTNLKIRTKGFDRGFVNGLAADYTISSIPAANSISGAGVYAGLVVDGVRVGGFDGQNYNFNPQFDYCYLATTQFREQVCVPSSRNTCDISVDKSKEQNGPVSVTLGSMQVVGNEILLPITLSNKGDGEVINECFNTEDYARNYKLVSVRLGSQEGDCEPSSSEDYAFLSGESIIYCRFDKDQEESYSSQVSIELSYTYQQGTSKTVRVVDPVAGIS